MVCVRTLTTGGVPWCVFVPILLVVFSGVCVRTRTAGVLWCAYSYPYGWWCFVVCVFVPVLLVVFCGVCVCACTAGGI